MHKLEPYKETILELKASGESIRSIAAKLGVPASTVQHAIKTWSMNDENKKNVQVDQAALLERMDHVEVLLAQLQARVEQNEQLRWEQVAYGAAVLRSPDGRGITFRQKIQGTSWWEKILWQLQRLLNVR